SLSADSAPLAIYSLSLHDALPIFEALLHRGHVRQVPVLGELHLFDPAGAELLHGDFAEVGAVAGAIELARAAAWETVGGPVDHLLLLLEGHVPHLDDERAPPHQPAVDGAR